MERRGLGEGGGGGARGIGSGAFFPEGTEDS